MNMGRKLGIFFMCIGAVSLLGALALFAYNQWESETAAETAEDLLKEVKLVVAAEKTPAPTAADKRLKEPEDDWEEAPMPTFTPEPTIDPTMTEQRVRGYWCVGYLTIPALDLELPVMNSWSKENGKAGPCKYYGSTKTANLVICAHSYKKYFGRIDQLKAGDEVIFTDMDGTVWQYEVAETEILIPTAIAEMTAGEYALTLFSCTPEHNRRITVRCRAK